MSTHTHCDICGKPYEGNQRYLDIELLGRGLCMVQVQVRVRSAGFARDVCIGCQDFLMKKLLDT